MTRILPEQRPEGLAVNRRHALGAFAALAAGVAAGGAVAATSAPQEAHYQGPGFYELKAWPGRLVYVGPMPKGHPYGRQYLQAHQHLSTYPDPRHAILLFSRKRASLMLAGGCICEVSP